ncbi:TrmB family transcriptional regulator [Candidatus Pacearchaeota archaeon]|nr:TrmB family transcriptional regulator [Candidatus Pacearchaeota archaeon]
MIIKPELVRRIKDYFNLNIYETKVWLALLSKGIASAGEIAEISNVPRSRTYDVLESLEKRGFAIVKIGKPVKYISIKPTEIIEKMKTETLHEAHERVKSLVVLKDTNEYLELEQLHNAGIAPIKSSDITGSLKGRSNVISKLRDLIESSTKEVLICTSALDLEDKSRVLIPALEKLIKSNIKVKIALSGDAERVKRLNARFNLKAKHVEASARFFMADKKQALLMLTPETSEEEMGVWLNSEFFTESLHNLVEKTLRN